MTKTMIALFAAVALLASGCGGDDSGSTGQSTSVDVSATEDLLDPESSDESVDVATSESVDTVTTESADTGTDTASDTTSDTASPIAAGDPDVCGFAAFLSETEDSLVALFDPGPGIDREAVARSYIKDLDEWAARMPAEIADEFGILASSVEPVIDALAVHDWNLQAALEDPATAAVFSAQENDDELLAAETTLNAWFLDNCGVDLAAIEDDDAADEVLATLRLPFDPCAVAEMVDLSGLVDVDFTDGDGGGTFTGDAVVSEGCNWFTEDFSVLTISAIAFTDIEDAATDLRLTAAAFGGEIEDLSDRYPAPALSVAYDDVVTVYVLGSDAPFSVSYPDVATTHVIVELLAAQLRPVEGGVAQPD